jgi:uncharacterized protein with PQ loop repeat
MTNQIQGMHHYHVRKRVHRNIEAYPHPDKAKAFMDKMIFVVGALGPIMTIPQIVKIWMEKSAAGVSLISWGAYLFFAFFWLAYGIMHKEKPIIFTYILWIIFEALIVLGIIMYG